MKTKLLAVILLLCGMASAVTTTVNLSGTGRFKAFDPDTGALLAGGSLCSFVAGTTTPNTTYADSTGSVANSTCVILDGSGEAAIWLDPAVTYKLVLKDASSAVIWTLDGVNTPAAGVFTTLTVSGVVTFSSTVTATQFVSTAATGTKPFNNSGNSTTKVDFFNADQVDGGDWANPGAAIGSGTRVPSTSQFTNINVSGPSVLSGGTSITNPTIVTGVAADGSGFKHKRVAGCATAAAIGATCDTTITWGTAFADSSYTSVCTGDGSAAGVPLIEMQLTKGAASILVRTYALTAAVATFSFVNCIAVHD